MILAAGVGQRLFGWDLPKTLLPIREGLTLLDWQLLLLQRYFPFDHVIIVVGYRREKIEERYSRCIFVENPHFTTTNTAISLLLALRAIAERAEEGDLLLLNGDLLFHPNSLRPLLQSNYSSLLVRDALCQEEEVKVTLDRDGFVAHCGKELLQPFGEAVGLNFFLHHDLQLLQNSLERCDRHDFFERAIELAIEKGMRILPTIIAGQEACEIDTKEDWQEAIALFRRWGFDP